MSKDKTQTQQTEQQKKENLIMNTMDYATSYKMAYDYDTMVNVVNNYRRQKAMEQAKQKTRRKRNKWYEIFPATKGIK